MGAQNERSAYSRVCGAATAKGAARLGYPPTGPALQLPHAGGPIPLAWLYGGGVV